MNAVERVLELCQQRDIPVSRLERHLGFSNGYIKRLKEGKLPTDRAQQIADYLGVTLSYLVNGADTDEGYYVDGETAEVAQQIFEDKELRALFDAAKGARPEDVRMAAEMLRRFKATNPGE
jgi:transcriptional regulator with XRE-family HTH domain